MNNNIKGKRILILGGSGPYKKIVTAAKQLGLYTIVVDMNGNNCESASLSDEVLQLSLLNVDDIYKWCIKNPVDGILNLCVDFAQNTLFELCKRLNLPCSYNQHSLDVLSSKTLFKKSLVENGLDIIPSYSEADIKCNNIDYPILIKPSVSSGSRGSSTCYNQNDALLGLENAKSCSRDNKAIIEKFIENAQEIQVTYFIINNQPYLIRTADSYEGNKEDKLERVVACSISPSKYTDKYIELCNDKIINMIKGLEIKNGPCFMQVFYKDGKFLFFDPGIRFPGVDFEKIFVDLFEIDFAKVMIELAITGKTSIESLPLDIYNLNNNKIAILFPFIKAGNIKTIYGLDILSKDSNIFSYSLRHSINDKINWTFDVNQRIAEIEIIESNIKNLKRKIYEIQEKLHVYNEDNKEMIFSHFDINRLRY